MNNVFLHGLILSSCILTADLAIASNIDDVFPRHIKGASLIYSGKKDYAKYDLVIGRMEYIEAADNEGFKPAAYKSLVGAIERRLYDYPQQNSAIEIFEKAVMSLQRQRYNILYRCSEQECGSAAGWKLFLNKKLGGDSSFQHYVVAAKEPASGESKYVVMYVNDLAGQPRALIDVVSVSKPIRSNKKDAAASANDDANKKRTSIYFDFGGYSLADRIDETTQAKQFVAANLENCPIHVIGYTDPVGTDSANKALAKARVDEVIRYVSDVNNLSPGCLIPDPRGVETKTTNDELKNSRRVDLEVASKR